MGSNHGDDVDDTGAATSPRQPAAGAPAPPPPKPTVCVVVLGDVGRSPRMQYHCRSLLAHGCRVDCVGYVDTAPLRCLRDDRNAQLHALRPFPTGGAAERLPALLRYACKALWAALTLLVVLLVRVRRPRFVLVQNPPAVPALLVCWLFCALTRARLIVDWHNYTHTILALDAGGADRPVVRMARWAERLFGRWAAAGLCVTRAMQRDLAERWGIAATVFYDRPAPQFRPLALEWRHELFQRLAGEYAAEFAATAEQLESGAGGAGAVGAEVESATRFTVRLHGGEVRQRPDRPALLVSSTSWTPDEDFGMLLEALDGRHFAKHDFFAGISKPNGRVDLRYSFAFLDSFSAFER